MKMNVMRLLTASFFLLLSVAVVPLLLAADGAEPRRGDFPRCQSSCLATHSEKMEKLMNEYGQKGNRVSFQEDVDSALAEYRSCIVNCREPMPVK